MRLAFDAQLSATEIVRRCERRIGELIREGQREGTIAKTGDIGAGDRRGDHLIRPHEALGQANRAPALAHAHYTMADAPAEEFEQAITTAREEGNLSRANVVRSDPERRCPTRTHFVLQYVYGSVEPYLSQGILSGLA